MKTILITGGCGYIGSHLLEDLLLSQCLKLIVVDNLSNGSLDTLRELERLYNRTILFYRVDLEDGESLELVFQRHPEIDAVVHLAGIKNIRSGGSFEENVDMTRNLLTVMELYGVNKLLFASSAAVYGDYDRAVLVSDGLVPVSDYGKSKVDCENLIRNAGVDYMILRYFNPYGWRYGFPKGSPNFVSEMVMAVRENRPLEIYQGLGIERDFIFINVLTEYTVKCLIELLRSSMMKCSNVGSGISYSLEEVIDVYESVSGENVEVDFVTNDVAEVAYSCSANGIDTFGLKYGLEKGTVD